MNLVGGGAVAVDILKWIMTNSNFAVKEFGRGHASLKMVKLGSSAIGCHRHVIDIGPLHMSLYTSVDT